MKDLRSAALLFTLAPLTSACTDDLPTLPGNDASTGTPETTGITTFPATTTGQTPPPPDATAGEATDGGTTTSDDTGATDSTSDAVDTSSGDDDSTSTGSGGSTTDEPGEESSGSTAGADDDTIYEIQDGTIGTGTSVDVQGVVVTGVAGNAIFVQEPAGGEYSGVYVFLNAAPTVALGDEVDLVGVTAEFNDLTEIDLSGGSITPTGVTGVVITPEVVGIGDLDPAVGEPWEGVVVRIEGMPLEVVDLPGFDEFYVGTGGPSARIDNFLYSVFDFPATYPNFVLGASFTAIQGPLNYTFGEYKVSPRQAADLEGYMPGPPPSGTPIDDLSPGDLVITEVMFDPNCLNDDCEFIEVYNASGVDVSLQGLRIQDSNFSAQGTIVNDVLLPAGGYAVLGSNDAGIWPYTAPADAHYGNNPAFNNTGDLAAILNSTEVLDQTATYPTFGIADNGISWKLDPAMLDATANDDAANWCFSTMVFDSPGGVDEFGSPGAANEAACAVL
ncbi:MAG: lamin tail domain-containing protein [Myxococcota bacterium]